MHWSTVLQIDVYDDYQLTERVAASYDTPEFAFDSVEKMEAVGGEHKRSRERKRDENANSEQIKEWF